MPRQHDIRLAWQVLAVNPEPVAHPVQQRPNRFLRLRVLAVDAGHQGGPVLLIDCTHKDMTQNVVVRSIMIALNT